MCRLFAVVVSLVCLQVLVGCAGDPLPSWRDGEARERIIAFVESASDPGGAGFVPEEERIAVFDNDGTLWAEKPVYFQLQFALDRVAEMAADRPEWRGEEPYRSAIARDWDALAALDREQRTELLMATHAGMTTDAFGEIAEAWLATARHPETGAAYTEMVYRPMLELLEYLRARGFKTYIVSGGGVEFIRAIAEESYGIPPEQVIGSRLVTEYIGEEGGPALRRVGEWGFINDGPGKPVGIHERIGRRPVMAVGNSDGDFEMLEWTTAGPGARLGVLIHHTDGERAYSYDRESAVGRLERGLDEGPARGWLIVDTKADWGRMFVGDVEGGESAGRAGAE